MLKQTEHIYKQKIKRKSKGNRKAKVRNFTSTQEFSRACFLTIPLSQSSHNQFKNKLVNLELKDQDQKRSQSNKIDLRMFCEKILL